MKTVQKVKEVKTEEVISGNDTAAMLDRILHHCTTINVKGESYRLKERKKHGLVIP